jgi:SAM-dependent methyltransferase
MKKDPATDTEVKTGWGLKTFSRDALDKIHTATLDVLRSTGVRADCNEALDIPEKGGCREAGFCKGGPGLSDRLTYKLVALGPLLFNRQDFDVVFSKDAVIHIEDKEPLLADIFRILQPGGQTFKIRRRVS